ncbi:MAG: TFIIB-type zinc ribbon-containing protein [Longimicrobiales bacterium]
MSEFTHRLPHQPWPKPSRNEDKYFHLEDFRKRMEAAREREAARAQDERQRWLDAHQGHCPRCGSRLERITLEEGSADQCPGCLGVWLDHGLFDRLTHPHEENQYLTGILRGLLLQFTTGDLKTPHPKG